MKVRYAKLSERLLGFQYQRGKLGKYYGEETLELLMKLSNEGKLWEVTADGEVYEYLGEEICIEINQDKPLRLRLEGWLHELLEFLLCHKLLSRFLGHSYYLSEVFDRLWFVIVHHDIYSLKTPVNFPIRKKRREKK